MSVCTGSQATYMLKREECTKVEGLGLSLQPGHTLIEYLPIFYGQLEKAVWMEESLTGPGFSVLVVGPAGCQNA